MADSSVAWGSIELTFLANLAVGQRDNSRIITLYREMGIRTSRAKSLDRRAFSRNHSQIAQLCLDWDSGY